MFLKILMVAGSDTTSVVLAAITFYLVSNPEYLQIAFNEVRGIFETYENIFSGARLSSCAYLQNCIDDGKVERNQVIFLTNSCPSRPSLSTGARHSPEGGNAPGSCY